VLWFGLIFALVILVLVFMKDAPYFQYREMGIDIDPDALLLACGEELVPSGTAMQSLRKAASDWRTWILTYLYFVSFGGFIALTVWLPTYWAEYFTMSLVQAGALTALYSLSTSLLRVLGGFTSDRLGGERVTLMSFIIVGIGALAMMLAAGSTGMAITGEVILALGMGFANAAVFKLVPKYSPAAVGGAAGIVGGLGAFGGFVIPPLMGLFVKFNGSAGYAQGFGVFIGLSLLSIVLIAVLNRQAPVNVKEAVSNT